MSVHRTIVLVVLLLTIAVASGCAKPRPRDQVATRTVPRGEYATLRQVDRTGPLVRFWKLQDIEETSPPWLELEVNYLGRSWTHLVAYDDKLVCTRRWQPWAHGGYVLFEPGTDSPVSYEGDFGVCVTEPPLSKRHRSVDELTCSFSDEQTVRVHGFAWPEEVDSEQEAMALSQKRADAIKERLGSTALPDRLAGVEAHGTKRTGVTGDQGPEVIGAYFEIHPPAADDSRLGLPVTPQFFVDVAPAPPQSMRADLETLLASSRIRGVPAKSVSGYDDPGHDVVMDADGEYRSVFRPYIKLEYRPERGESRDRAMVYSAAWNPQEFRQAAIVRWAEKIIDEECGTLRAAPAERAEPEGQEK